MKPNKAIIKQLENSEIARNDHKQGYIDYICNHYCENEMEIQIIKSVLDKSITGSSYVRQVAEIQNKLGLHKPTLATQNRRSKYEKRIRQDLSKNTLFTSIARWFNNK